jgi:predicted TIM-barrel fold metal-dependent hydrolase
MPAPQIVSVDDHVLETPDIWRDRLPVRYLEIGPHVVRERGLSKLVATESGAAHVYARTDDGVWCDVWRYEDVAVPLIRRTALVGFEADDDGDYPISFEDVRPGCYDPVARLADMDHNDVAASLNFPNEFVRFAGQRFLMAKNRELALLCVRAYNDWVIDVWCAGSGGRLIPLCIVPLWDSSLAAAEVRRTAAQGAKAISFSELPANLGLPSIYSHHWDALFEACSETDTVLSIHIGSGSKMPGTSADAYMATTTALPHLNCVMSLTDWLLSGVLPRFANLRVLFAECQIGWLPYQLDRLDYVWKKNFAWAWGDHHGHEILPKPPTEYFRKQILCSFFDDPHGVRSIEEAGLVDNVALEVDYPHGDSTWPRSAEIAASIVATLEPGSAHKVIGGNAERFLRL